MALQRLVDDSADPSLPLTVDFGLDAGGAVAVGPLRHLDIRGTAVLARARRRGLSRPRRSSAPRPSVNSIRSPRASARRGQGLAKPVRCRGAFRGNGTTPWRSPIVRSIGRPPRSGGGGRLRVWLRSPSSPRWSPSRWLLAGRGQLGDRTELGRRPGPGIRRGHGDGGARGPHPGSVASLRERRVGDQPRCRDRHADRPGRAGDPRLDPGG